MSATIATVAPARAAKPWYKILYVQVLIAIMLGVVVGWLWPTLATNDWIKALGDGFIKLIRMVIAPIIFCTVVSGISHIQDARKVGRVGVKALVYFEVVSSFALMIGLVMGNLIQVGRGLAVTPDAAAVAKYVKEAASHKSVDFVLNIIPDSVVGALARGDILQVLLFAILFGFALMALGERGHRLRDIIDDTAHAVSDVEGRQRRHRRGLHHAGGNAERGQSGAGAGNGDRVLGRQIHERGSRAHQHHRQRRRRRRGVVVGRRTRSRPAARQSQPEHRP